MLVACLNILGVYFIHYLTYRSNRDTFRDNAPKPKINACVIVLARNADLAVLARTIGDFERNFNHRHNYPYVIFNRNPFTSNFKRTIGKLARAHVEFASIPENQWRIPKKLSLKKIRHSLMTIGHSVTYRHMCRFYSGFFFQHPATLPYDYYMRIDVDSLFPCPIERDPFEMLTKENKTYGFRPQEYAPTVVSLWPRILEWLNASGLNENEKAANTLAFISDDNGRTLSQQMCIFYNNFEVATFALFRSPSYLSYFTHLDRSGGFYFERWGDAPVHTYYVNLMLDRSQVHMFRNFSYGHYPEMNFRGKVPFGGDIEI